MIQAWANRHLVKEVPGPGPCLGNVELANLEAGGRAGPSRKWGNPALRPALHPLPQGARGTR